MILSFYKFIILENLPELKAALQKKCLKLNIKGTIIIAHEGINLNIEGEQEKISYFCDFLKEEKYFNNIEYKTRSNQIPAFKKLKVKIKKQIITAKIDNIDVKNNKGTYLSPQEWDNLLSDSKTMLIDTRNYYEYAMGTFKGAINPKIHSFSELKNWLDSNLQSISKERNIAMFCTGGIRCEKSTAYLKQQGFQNIYQLKGGVISYLSSDTDGNKWQGKCFLFDDNISF